MKKLNNIIIILLKNGKKICLDIADYTKAQSTAISFLIHEGIPHTEVKQIISIPSTQYTAYEYQHYFNEATGIMNKKEILIDKKIEEIRKRRGLMFNKLDLEFMRTLEQDNLDGKEHIVTMKNYLRDLPVLLEETLPNLTEKEIQGFNEYNNIFRIFLMDGGEGYSKAPKITIDPPKGAGDGGFQLKAIATINEGKVNSVIITQYGSGYSIIPEIKFSDPDSGDKQAFAIASDPENDIFQNN